MTFLALAFGLAMGGSSAWAGVFNLPHFVMPGDYAIGLEPELTLTHGAGVGANLKYTQGVSELTNVQAVIGTGSGPRRFRVGGSMVFDFFPDIPGQAGIGVATQGIYYRLKEKGQFELTAIPYIHKNFKNEDKEIEPYFALPFGVAFQSGTYEGLTTAVVGAQFKASEHFRYTAEVGVAVNHSESYFAGGVTYYHF